MSGEFSIVADEMRVTVYPSEIHGRLLANPSKSHAQRAIALAALAPGTSLLEGIGQSADTRHALAVAAALGAEITGSGNHVSITGGRSLKDSHWHCGESGFSFRMFSAIAGIYDRQITISASGSLLSRPNGFVVETLNQMGVDAGPPSGVPPISIHGPFQNTELELDGSLSSQFLSGLLLALPNQPKDVVLSVRDLVSVPYITMTLETLQAFGISIRHDRYQTFAFHGNQTPTPAQLQIAGDWSGMAFLLVAGIISGDLIVSGLTHPSAQADARIMDVLNMSQCTYMQHDRDFRMVQSDPIAFDFDATHCPDLIPALVPLALAGRGTSRINGVHRLRAKESDRAAALISEFATLGAHLSVEEDALIIPGGSVHGGVVDAHGDHRIAMALATAGLRASGPVTITGAEHVSKSYPGFFQDLMALGAQLTIQD